MNKIASAREKNSQPQYRVSIREIQFKNPPQVPEKQILVTPGETPVEENFQVYNKQIHEAGINEVEIEGNFSMSLEMPENPATCYSYTFINNKIIKYSSELYNPVIVEKFLRPG
jgi:hypothetical protein